MNGGGFGALWRIRTRKHIRTTRSIPTSTGRRGGAANRDGETAHIKMKEEQLQDRQRLHEQRRVIQRLLDAGRRRR